MTVYFGKIYADDVKSGKVEQVANGQARAGGTRKGKNTPESTSALVPAGKGLAADESKEQTQLVLSTIPDLKHHQQGKDDLQYQVAAPADFDPKIGEIIKSIEKDPTGRKQRALNNAESADDVLDALEALLPQPKIEQFDAHSQHRHNNFVRQLQFIKAGIDTQIAAVCDYLKSSKMRLRWSAKMLKKERLDAFHRDLYSIYKRHFDANLEGSDPAESRGMHTFNDTISEANKTDSIRIRGTDREVEFPFGTIEGEYHHMANGEDGLKVGWHPDWERKLAEGDYV